jgi:hypothetical protein
MIKNRISKFFRPMVESQEQPEPPKVNPSAFIAMPTGLAPSTPGVFGPGAAPAPMNIYEIALAEAQRKIAESRANELGETDDLSGWIGEGL